MLAESRPILVVSIPVHRDQRPVYSGRFGLHDASEAATANPVPDPIEFARDFLPLYVAIVPDSSTRWDGSGNCELMPTRSHRAIYRSRGSELDWDPFVPSQIDTSSKEMTALSTSYVPS